MLAEDEVTKRSLPRRPKHTGSVALDYDVSERARIGAEAVYVGSQRDSNFSTNFIKSHTTANVTGSFDIDDQHTIYADLNNIFDKDYQEVVNFQAPGFTAYVGLRAKY